MFKGSISYNLKTHIQIFHLNEATILEKTKNDYKKSKYLNTRYNKIITKLN